MTEDDFRRYIAAFNDDDFEGFGRFYADDVVFEAGPVRIAVDRLSLPYVQGTLVDLAQEGLARKLRFDNPNARQSCGCGESFSA